MNPNQLINMVVRMIMRQVVGRGINAGINMASNKMAKRHSDEGDREQAAQGRELAKGAKQAMRVTRRMGRF